MNTILTQKSLIKKTLLTMGAALFAGTFSVSALAASAQPLSSSQDNQMHEQLDSSMKTMHMNMMKGMESDSPDLAFAQGMLPHHVGAIKMAQVELKYGKDPHMRKLARNIIKAQEHEVGILKKWIATHQQRK
ncbi:hypothetical protein LMG33818_000762 [Halomonadaceae bacterium LMG 33818]|uniref:CopM family metallochaperone n=1 Tax=Cernens ardua TaxID=3402176 RepID=UPI003EDBD9F6